MARSRARRDRRSSSVLLLARPQVGSIPPQRVKAIPEPGSQGSCFARQLRRDRVLRWTKSSRITRPRATVCRTGASDAPYTRWPNQLPESIGVGRGASTAMRSAGAPGSSSPRRGSPRNRPATRALVANRGGRCSKPRVGSSAPPRSPRNAARSDRNIDDDIPSVPRPTAQPRPAARGRSRRPTPLLAFDSGLCIRVAPAAAARS